MRPDDRPQSQKIAADLRALIMAKRMEPGEKLPSTAQLAERYKAATATVQNAVKLLKDEGFVTSRTGAGVYVRDRQPFVVDVAAYYDPASRNVAYKLLGVSEVQVPEDVAEALGEDTAILRYRRTEREGEPVELSWSYYPLSLVAGTPLTGRSRIRGGAPAVLAELGYPEREFVDHISVRPPTSEEVEGLDLPEGVPILRQFRVIYSNDRKPIEVSIIVKPGHLYELMYSQVIPVEKSL
jgi:GntR family transcriptional regulator